MVRTPVNGPVTGSWNQENTVSVTFATFVFLADQVLRIS